MKLWQQWMTRPQTLWLRKALFQIHLWSGIGVGLYVLMASVTGSIVVYRNEMYEAFNDRSPTGVRFVSWLLELHDDLLAGSTGRSVNGLGAVLVILMAVTGIVVWWPGIQSWRRGLTIHRNVGWRRLTWDLHSMIGFWSIGFVVLFGLSGVYLGHSETFQNAADWLQPPTEANAGTRLVDKILYWLAYLHFGRINGIGIPCKGPGLCDQSVKLVWALFGLAPAILFVTGSMMWWNRVVRKRLKL